MITVSIGFFRNSIIDFERWLEISIPNSFIVEYVVEEGNVLREEISSQDIQVDDGWVNVPNGPGLGVTLNDEAIARYRAIGNQN